MKINYVGEGVRLIAQDEHDFKCLQYISRKLLKSTPVTRGAKGRSEVYLMPVEEENVSTA